MLKNFVRLKAGFSDLRELTVVFLTERVQVEEAHACRHDGLQHGLVVALRGAHTNVEVDHRSNENERQRRAHEP